MTRKKQPSRNKQIAEMRKRVSKRAPEILPMPITPYSDDLQSMGSLYKKSLGPVPTKEQIETAVENLQELYDKKTKPANTPWLIFLIIVALLANSFISFTAGYAIADNHYSDEIDRLAKKYGVDL